MSTTRFASPTALECSSASDMWIGVLFLIFLNDLNEEKEVEPTGENGGTHGKSGDCEVGRARAGGGAGARVRGVRGGVATRVAGLHNTRRGTCELTRKACIRRGERYMWRYNERQGGHSNWTR